MGMSVTHLVSMEEYLTTSYDPDCDYVDGELEERNVGETDHGGLQGVLTAWLFGRRRQLGIHIFPETRLQVAARRFRVPDITVTTYKAEERILRKPPLLCIEILSPEDRASRVEKRIEDYLRMGVPHVWLIDPAERHAWSYSSDGTRKQVDVLTTDSPRIEISLDEIFAELSGDVELSPAS